MQTKISRPDFEAMVRRAGLTLNQAQVDTLHTAFGYVEGMVENVRLPARGREPEPALIFVPEIH